MDSTARQAAAWCALLRAPGIGSQTLNPSADGHAPPRQLIEAPPSDLPGGLRDYLRNP